MRKALLDTVAKCVETSLLATGVIFDIHQNVKMMIFISSPTQAVRGQVSLLLLQDILQASCEGRPDLGL